MREKTKFVLLLCAALTVAAAAWFAVPGGGEGSRASPFDGDASTVRATPGEADPRPLPLPKEPVLPPKPKEPELRPEEVDSRLGGTLVTCDQKSATALDLVRMLADRAGVPLVVDPGAKRALAARMNVNLADSSAEQALDLICSYTGTEYETTDDGKLRVFLGD